MGIEKLKIPYLIALLIVLFGITLYGISQSLIVFEKYDEVTNRGITEAFERSQVIKAELQDKLFVNEPEIVVITTLLLIVLTVLFIWEACERIRSAYRRAEIDIYKQK